MNPDEELQWQGCAAPEEEWGGGEGGARVLFCPGCEGWAALVQCCLPQLVLGRTACRLAVGRQTLMIDSL